MEKKFSTLNGEYWNVSLENKINQLRKFKLKEL